MIFKMGELFCGPGGLALGAKQAYHEAANGSDFAIRHAWATDYDKDSCNSFRRNICPDNPSTVLCKDIRKIKYENLMSISDVDALSFGFPCNDFSVVGEQKGIDGIYGPLYTYCTKALRFFKPIWFLAENVGGLKNSNDGTALSMILDEFRTAGYKLYPHYYKFENYGIPQTRHRIIIIGIRNDADVEFRIPSPQPYLNVDISCGTALNKPPIPEHAHNHDFTNQSDAVVARLKYIKPGENAFTANIPKHLRLNIKGAKLSIIYRRLDSKKPAYTITGSGGGGTHVYHWKENRALTNRERARLQTFPDNFVFCGSKESVRKQIGMAVPPKMANIIYTAVLRCFAGKRYSAVPCNMSKFHQNVFQLSD